MRESTIAAGLRHPHVVPILDFGETRLDQLGVERRDRSNDRGALLVVRTHGGRLLELDAVAADSDAIDDVGRLDARERPFPCHHDRRRVVRHRPQGVAEVVP